MRKLAFGPVLFLSILLLGCGAQAPEAPALPVDDLPTEPVPGDIVTDLEPAETEETPQAPEPVQPDTPEPAPEAREPEARPETRPEEPAGKAALPKLYDFWAEWCPPCREQKPIVEELKQEYAGQVDIVMVNVDEEAELAQQYEVRVIPTLVFIDAGGNEVERLTGLNTKDKLLERFRAHGFIE